MKTDISRVLNRDCANEAAYFLRFYVSGQKQRRSCTSVLKIQSCPKFIKASKKEVVGQMTTVDFINLCSLVYVAEDKEENSNLKIIKR